MTGKKLGRYEIIRTLGKGAMGLVYEGHDPVLQRHVAIKTIIVDKLDARAAEEYEIRFRTEALAAARLLHPNIVPVFDFGRDGEVAYLVMQFIDGDDLKTHLDNGEYFSPAMVVSMILDLLAALDHAHENNIVHRDVKPANMLIEKGRVKLTDFGVARIQDADAANRTQVGAAGIGTPRYMSPEQAQGQRVDHRTDLFSTGVVLYELLTGVRPFDGDNPFAVIHQIVNTLPPPPTFHNPKLPKAIDAVLAKALAKNRDDRFSSAREFALALKSAGQRLGGGAGQSQSIPPPQPTAAPAPAPAARAPDTSNASSINLELELEYWKDIKDSDDVQDFVAFLQSFPNGKFAALAQRRLRKLGYEPDASSKGSGQGTNAGQSSPMARSSSSIGDDEETRLPGQMPIARPSGGPAGASGLGLSGTGSVPVVSPPKIDTEVVRIIEEAKGAVVARQADAPQQHSTQDVARLAEAQRLAADALQREIEAKRQAEEEQRRREDEEARRQAEEARRLAAEAEARRIEQERREAEAKRLAEEAEARRQAEEAEARRKAEEAEAKRLAAEAEARRVAADAEARRVADAEAKRLAEEAEAKRLAEEAEAKRKADEAEAKRKAEEAEAKRLAAEAEAKRQAEAEARRKAEEAEAKRRAAEAEAKRKAEEAEAKRKAAETEAKRKAEEEQRKAEDKRRFEAELEAKRQAAERQAAEARRQEEARRQAEEKRKAEQAAAELLARAAVVEQVPETQARAAAVAAPVARTTERAEPAKKSKLVPMAIAGVVALTAVGVGVKMMMGGKTEEAATAVQAPVATPPNAAETVAKLTTPEPKPAAAPVRVPAKAPEPAPAAREPAPPANAEADTRRKAEEARKAAAEKAVAEKAEKAEKAALDKAAKDKLAAEKAAADKLAAEKAATEKAAKEKLTAEKAAADKLAAEKAAAEKAAAAQKAAADKLAADKAAADRAAAEKAAADKAAAEKVAAEKAAAEKAAADKAAAAAREKEEKVASAAPASPSQLYQQGRSAESSGNINAAIAAYKRAASAGSGPAAKRLYEIYSRGEGGIDRDMQAASSWAQVAQKNGETISGPARMR